MKVLLGMLSVLGILCPKVAQVALNCPHFDCYALLVEMAAPPLPSIFKCIENDQLFSTLHLPCGGCGTVSDHLLYQHPCDLSVSYSYYARGTSTSLLIIFIQRGKEVFQAYDPSNVFRNLLVVTFILWKMEGGRTRRQTNIPLELLIL